MHNRESGVWKDEIVDEIHRGREEYAARFNYDIAAMVRDIQQRQDQERLNGRVYVTLPPKRVEEEASQPE